jgi:hypothetical protein
VISAPHAAANITHITKGIYILDAHTVLRHNFSCVTGLFAIFLLQPSRCFATSRETDAPGATNTERALALTVDSRVALFPVLSDWTNGEEKPIKKYKAVLSKSPRI